MQEMTFLATFTLLRNYKIIRYTIPTHSFLYFKVLCFILKMHFSFIFLIQYFYGFYRYSNITTQSLLIHKKT